MKKLSENAKLLITIALIVTLASAATAVYWIYSRPVSVTVTEYSLSLMVEPTTVVKNHNVTFTATLTGPDVDGKTITFYRTDETGAILETLGTNTTDPSGVAILSWNMTYSAGSYYFIAGYEVP
ncbi:MAG: hypothetical protein QXR76_03240 [Candidatus Bathyarchaeia archaeon]